MYYMQNLGVHGNIKLIFRPPVLQLLNGTKNDNIIDCYKK